MKNFKWKCSAGEVEFGERAEFLPIYDGHTGDRKIMHSGNRSIEPAGQQEKRLLQILMEFPLLSRDRKTRRSL